MWNVCICSENEKKCTLDQAFRVIVEEEIVSILNCYNLSLDKAQISICKLVYYFNSNFSVRKCLLKT